MNPINLNHVNLTYTKTADQKEQILITNKENNQVISSIGCKIISSSVLDTIKEFFLTLGNWKWVKADGLTFEGKKIIVNKKDLQEKLGIDDELLALCEKMVDGLGLEIKNKADHLPQLFGRIKKTFY